MGYAFKNRVSVCHSGPDRVVWPRWMLCDAHTGLTVLRDAAMWENLKWGV